MLVKELTGASCGRPFEHLGWVAGAAGELLLRVWLPDAVAVEVQPFDPALPSVPMTCTDKAGLFEVSFPQQSTPFHYRLVV